METKIREELFDYMVKMRRQFHRYPEVGFDLERTVSTVKEELKQMGITYTERYGKCSLVAELGFGEKIIALRADMNSFPVEEKTDLPYCSEIAGCMHACGHDSHVAVLLGVAKYLKSREEELKCKVRLIFQPSEEGAISGGKMMVENKVMDGVDHILCTHCENFLETGWIGVCPGDYMAACVPATIRFHGVSAHAALPVGGVDAIAMAVEAYGRMREMVKEEAGENRYIWSVGRMDGGQVHNVVADLCQMEISFRFYDMQFQERVKKRVFAICEEIAASFGGSAEIIWNISTGAIHNDEKIYENFIKSVRKQNLPLHQLESRMSSEDFGWYLTKTPGLIFRFGTRNEEMGCISAPHRSDFKLDENGMDAALQAFCGYILDYANE